MASSSSSAGAIAQASRLKPEIRLAQAVSEFEAALSQEQKADFRANRDQPDPVDVMRLTAEIDRRVRQKSGIGGRCVGPRLTNFLQATQQFAALGDVIVGGSQNLIACGVWSLVRMTLLAIVNVSAYLEKLSLLFMHVGRSAPRYQDMALLYSRSKRLQSQLSEYFISVVEICRHLMQYAKKTLLGKFVSSLSDSDLKAFQTGLERHASLVKEEITFLMGQKIEDEAQQNSRIRTMVTKLSESARHRSILQTLQTNQRVLNACSTYNHESDWKRTRKLGNIAVLDQIPEYIQWRDASTSQSLLCLGTLGCGKSVLLANMVDDLHLYTQGKNTIVAYFFVQYDLYKSLLANTILGSFAWQCLSSVRDLTEGAKYLDGTSGDLDNDQILNLLQLCLPSNQRIFLVLDGIDECDQGEKDNLLSHLRKAQDTFRLSICFAFRSQADNAQRLDMALFISPITVSVTPNEADMASFVTAELEACIEFGKLTLGDPALVLEIRDALLDGANGMFLWAILQIKSLCTEQTDEAIRKALANLPADLPATYSRILQTSSVHAKEYQQRVLDITVAALRPLTVNELREALSVVPGLADWNPARLPNNMHSTLASCGGLMVIDEEDETIGLIHHTIKKFWLEQQATEMPISRANAIMADIVVTYLNYGVFDRRVSSTVIPRLPANAMPKNIIASRLGSAGSSKSLALKLLKATRKMEYDIGPTVAEATRIFDHASSDDFHFYSYAKAYVMQHIAYSSLAAGPHEHLLMNILNRDEVRALAFKGVESGNEAIVALLLRTGQIDTQTRDDNGVPLLNAAVKHGRNLVAKLLLEVGKCDPNSKDIHGHTPLMLAASSDFDDLVEMLLAAGADANAIDASGCNVLDRALYDESINMLSSNSWWYDSITSREWGEWVERERGRRMNPRYSLLYKLAEAGADLNSSTALNTLCNPLMLAVISEDRTLVEALLIGGADPNYIRLRVRWVQTPLTALLCAILNRDRTLVKVLLEAGANTNFLEVEWVELLAGLIRNERSEITELLLEAGADMHLQSLTDSFPR